ncbi:hypothetical protein JTB14_003902 [Gonioctena quinquepunctata]|nr:hypothetical protein JTB14_003902 [Gonioctena quinquepunctata]
MAKDYENGTQSPIGSLFANQINALKVGMLARAAAIATASSKCEVKGTTALLLKFAIFWKRNGNTRSQNT